MHAGPDATAAALLRGIRPNPPRRGPGSPIRGHTASEQPKTSPRHDRGAPCPSPARYRRVPGVPTLPRSLLWQRGLGKGFHLRASLFTRGCRATYRPRTSTAPEPFSPQPAPQVPQPSSAKPSQPAPGRWPPTVPPRLARSEGTGNEPPHHHPIPRLRSRGTFSSPLSFRPAGTGDRRGERVRLATGGERGSGGDGWVSTGNGDRYGKEREAKVGSKAEGAYHRSLLRPLTSAREVPQRT